MTKTNQLYCKSCDKNISYVNWSKHKKTKSHINKITSFGYCNSKKVEKQVFSEEYSSDDMNEQTLSEDYYDNSIKNIKYDNSIKESMYKDYQNYNTNKEFESLNIKIDNLFNELNNIQQRQINFEKNILTKINYLENKNYFYDYFLERIIKEIKKLAV